MPDRPPLEFAADAWQNDQSLRRAGELLSAPARPVRAVSFDFFDTLVWRLAARPTDVFVEAGRRLHQAGLLPAQVSDLDYETLRRHAEAKAREQQVLRDKTREDISLPEIFHELKNLVPDGQAAVQSELGAESDFCVLNPDVLSFARHVRQLGLKRFIISDIYLSADQLRAILQANHLDPALFDGIFTSREAGVCKWTGKLFAHVLRQTGLKPAEMLHIGDNWRADVAGARKAGVRGCHYLQGTAEAAVVLERERFLLGGQMPVGNAQSLRLLAARRFPNDSDEHFFGRAGAFLLGPLLTRYATWACEQFVAAGVRKIGAFMREGEILGEMLRREAAAMGHALDIEPLYVNRKSTELAALGKLTAEKIMGWLERRQTLPVKTILEHFGVHAADLRQLPIGPDEKINSRERLLQFAKFLFQPELVRRIEQASAAERRKVMDYLQPWIASGPVFGVCDVGYNATAQMQLRHIFELEGCRTKMTGCYLVTCERAARRVIDGLDVRHFLGAFGHPGFHHFAFMRSPAFIEQSLVAPCGTTLGYERDATGAVHPVLDPIKFPAELLRRQRAFKDGVLHYQNLWLQLRAGKPGLLDGTTGFSRRLLADIDASNAPILARVTAFPTANEVAHFGSLPLDDYYFAEQVKTICGEKEGQLIRAQGYATALGSQSVLWPQGANQLVNPTLGRDFFAFGKAMLLGQPGHDFDGIQPALTIIVRSESPARLQPLLASLARCSQPDLCREVFLLVPQENPAYTEAAAEFAKINPRLGVFTRQQSLSLQQQLNQMADRSTAQFLLFLDDSAQLSAAWEQTVLDGLDENAGGALATPDAAAFALRRQAFAEALGFADDLSLAGASWNLLLAARELGWQIKAMPNLVIAASPHELPAADRRSLAAHFPNWEATVSEIAGRFAIQAPAPTIVNWIGSFLDHGSLAHVNRELAGALNTFPGLQIRCATNGSPVAADAGATWPHFVKAVAAPPAANAAVTVRHAWPPNWKRPAHGQLVVIQPWEFGSLPAAWVAQARDVDEFWVPSEYVRQVYLRSGVPADKVFVVPNGVNVEKFHPQAAPMELATKKQFKFLFVGGTIGRKGPDLLLQAYLKNFTAADDVCLVIKDFGGKSVYTGQTFEAGIRAAQARPNAPEVLYLNGELPPDSLPGLYTACDCLVLPYRGEGFGLPVIEAMACGLPVIVTAGGATDDFVRDEFAHRIPAARKVFGHEVSGMKLAGEGWLLEPDVAALGEKMRLVIQDPAGAKQRGRLARDHAQKHWTWQKSAAIAARRLRELVSASRAPVAAAAQPPGSPMPPTALVGQLAEARQLLGQKNLEAAWQAATEAIARRPVHPEAFLLLAEIALAAGAGKAARLCAQHARTLAPAWPTARQFLAQPLKGDAKPAWLQPESALNRSQSPRLSVCLIVKNEERFLAPCLKSIRTLGAQIVVVDTGSTDRTVEIAREFGAEIYSFAWCDDFAAARNAALEHARGEWVLMLDADEELPAAQHDRLAADMKAATTLGYRLPLANAGQENEGRSYVPRLFRNVPGAFFKGRIHEQIFARLLEQTRNWGLKTALGTAEILHHGYARDLVQDRNKIERNLKLLRAAVGEDPRDVNLMMNLGMELVRAGDLAAGIEKYREAYRMMSAQPLAELVPELREVLLTQFTSQIYKLRAFDEIVQVLNSPLAQRGGLTASLHFALGLAQFELKQFREAADQMRQCLAKRQQRCLTPINTDILTAAPHHCLALCLAQLGAPEAADQAFAAALTATGHTEKARLDYAKFLQSQSRPVEALQQLHTLVSANPQHAAAWQLGGQIALGRPEFLEFALDWTAETIKALPENPVAAAQRAEALLLNHQTTAAAQWWETLWRSEPEPHILAALILCEIADGQCVHAPNSPHEEEATSLAFAQWYQKLIASRAKPLVENLNCQLELLARVLPTAARMLQNALAETDAPIGA